VDEQVGAVGMFHVPPFSPETGPWNATVTASSTCPAENMSVGVVWHSAQAIGAETAFVPT
jgi:hypothetical protein